MIRRSLFLAAAGLLATAAHASGGGESPAGPLPTIAPSIPLTEFAGGHLGLLDSTFQRAYLVAAWRVLDGRPLSAPEAKLLSAALRQSSSYEVGADAEGRNAWQEALRDVGNASGPYPGIAQTRFSFGEKTADASLDLSSYPNCSLEATQTAARTLRERAGAYGDAAKNPWLADWVAGQLQVFSNCEKGFALPAEAPPNAPKWFRQDRAYQRAAARFYAGRFTEAREDFDAIANDSSSPWAELAPYLAARALLRRASLSKDPADTAPRTVEARLRFERLAGSGTPRQQRLATAMLRRIRASQQPAALLAEASRGVGELPWTPDTDLLLGDFLTLMRTAAERREAALGTGQPQEAWLREDGGMADWIADLNLLQHIAPAGRVFEEGYSSSSDPKVFAAVAASACRHAQGARHVRAWLLACVAAAPAPAAVPPPVLAQAGALRPGDPAYPTVRYHLLRLQVENGGPLPAVRQALEDALALGEKTWAPEGLNALSLLRAQVAGSVAEVLRFSRLQVVEDPPQYAWHREVARVVKPGARELYPAANVLLARGLTTATLAAASEDAALAMTERRHLRRLAWVRAAVLEQQELLDRLGGTLAADYPEHARELEAVRKAADTKARRFELARLLLADARFNLLYEENDSARGYDNYSGWNDTKPVGAPRGFFAPAQQRAADEEAKRLQQLQDSTSYIGNALVTWSQANPKDARLAQPLSQLVHATRNNGAVADKTVSRRAFQALHRLFPRSAAAKATPYHY